MSRIPTPALATATGATAEVYAQIKKAAGKVPNTYAAMGAHGTAVGLVRNLMQTIGTISDAQFSAIKAAGYTIHPVGIS